MVVDPAHQLFVAVVDLGLFGSQGFGDQDLQDFARPGFDRAFENLAGEAVDRDRVAGLEDFVFDRDGRGVVVDVQLAAADDTGLAHLAADEGRVRAGAAEGGENALGDFHSAQVFGAGLAANENQLDVVVLEPFGLGIGGVEADLARGGAGTGVDPLGQQAAGIDGGPLRFGIVDRLQQLVQVVGRNALGIEGFFFGDHPFVDQVDRDPHGGETGPLGVAGLQHPNLAALHRELDVLHVAIVRFELFADFDQLLGEPRAWLCRESLRCARGCGCRPPRLRPGR